MLSFYDFLFQATASEQAGPSTVREDSTPPEVELPHRVQFPGSDADYIQFLRQRLKEADRKIKVMTADAAIARTKLSQSLAHDEFYVQEMGRASQELLCKLLAQPPSAWCSLHFLLTLVLLRCRCTT